MFKKINAWLHLWLGLVSGIIVVIVSITGCMLVFEQEFKSIFDTEFNIKQQDESKLLPPSKIHAAVSAAIPGKEVHSIWYHGLKKAAVVSIDSDSSVYVNPFSGEVIAYKHHEDFFHEIDEGHRNLWMGRKIGSPIVGWATFIFFLLMISGMILWWPKKWTKTTRNQSFTVKWKAKFKRVNYDLHNVLGFYSLLLGILMAVTGLIMSFGWFSKSIYWLTGGENMQRRRPKREVFQDSPNTKFFNADKVWTKVRAEIALHNKNDIIISFQDKPGDAIYACTDMINGFWRDLYFDPVNLTLTKTSGKRLQDLKFPDQVRKLNYSMHVGAWGGLTTKILYFLASLICASLPITGFYIWWGKRKKAKPKPKTFSIQ